MYVSLSVPRAPLVRRGRGTHRGARASATLVDFEPRSLVKSRVVVLGSGWGAVSFVKNLSATGVDCTLVRCASCSTIVTPR